MVRPLFSNALLNVDHFPMERRHSFGIRAVGLVEQTDLNVDVIPLPSQLLERRILS
jgi:hypothetical protein